MNNDLIKDEPTQGEAVTEDSQPETTSQDVETEAAEAEKMLSQAHVNRIVAKAEKKAAEAALKKYQDEQAEAEMSELQKATKLIDALKAEADTAREEAKKATMLAALTGKVSNPKLAMLAIDDQHLDENGNLELKALLRDYPELELTTNAQPAVLKAGNATKLDSQVQSLETQLEEAMQKGNLMRAADLRVKLVQARAVKR